MKIKAQFLFSGFGDYWSGDSDRWDDNKGCLFAHYDHRTTLRDLIDSWVNDFCMGGDCDSLPEEVTESDVRAALLDMLNDKGRADYESGALSEFAKFYADCNDLNEDDEDDEHMESPVAIVLIECEICDDCGAWAEHYIDEMCIDCTEKHYPGSVDENGEFIC